MKEAIKSMIKSTPLLEKYIRLLRDRKDVTSLTPKKRIRGKNNVIKFKNSAILNNCTFDIEGNHNTIEINHSTVLNNVTFYIRGNKNKIKIDDNVKFYRGGELWIEDYHGSVIIGKHTTFENAHIAVTEPYSKISIGEDCMFAYGIDLRTGDSHSILDRHSRKRINYAQNIIIGDHVWVASHVSILKGVSIGSNCVVATRSVVTKNFAQDHILIGGSPAKILKVGIDWDRQRIYDEIDEESATA